MTRPARPQREPCRACHGLGDLATPACSTCQGTGVVAVRWVRCSATWVDLTAPEAARARRCGQLVRADNGLCLDHQRQQRVLAALAALPERRSR